MGTLIEKCLMGSTIRQLRLSKGLSQEGLAELMGYSVRHLRRIETCGTDSIDTVNAFARFFGVSANDILYGVSFFIF
jgi:transcriptional regulator with XRE-family HTH domain